MKNYNVLNILYGKLLYKKRLYNDLKQNVKYRSSIKFSLEYGIIVSGLSIIKTVLEKNRFNTGLALLLRNLIESYALINMLNSGDIDEKQKELFKYQHLLINYKLYNEMSNFERYIEYCKLVDYSFDKASKKIKNIDSNIDINKLLKQKIPFLNNKKMNFNIIVNKYYNEAYFSYKLLSIYAHPDGLNEIKIDMQLEQILNHYLNKLCNYINNNEVEITYYINKQKILENQNNKIYFDYYQKQAKLIKNIALIFKKQFNDNYVSRFFFSMEKILLDINSDYILGQYEAIKCKFKVVLENIASFTYFYFNRNNYNKESFTLLQYYDLFENATLQDQKIDGQYKKDAYDIFKKLHPQSQLNLEQFFNCFTSHLGYFMDESGKTIGYSKMIEKYLKEFMPNVNFKNFDFNFNDYFLVCYNESIQCSHGLGYLVKINKDFVRESWNIVLFLDASLDAILNELTSLFKNDSRQDIYTNLFKNYNELNKISKLKDELNLEIKKDFI